MANTRKAHLPKRFHSAVLKWRQTYLPDYDFLLDNWDKYFPRDQQFELCAYRELGMCTEIECGEMVGQPKFQRSSEMVEKQSGHLLGAIRAQASTEFGSIQQHQLPEAAGNTATAKRDPKGERLGLEPDVTQRNRPRESPRERHRDSQ